MHNEIIDRQVEKFSVFVFYSSLTILSALRAIYLVNSPLSEEMRKKDPSAKNLGSFGEALPDGDEAAIGDFLRFAADARLGGTSPEVRAAVVDQTLSATLTGFSATGDRRLYAASLSLLFSEETIRTNGSKTLKKTKSETEGGKGEGGLFTLRIFDPSLATGFGRLCGADWKARSFHETKTQLDAAACYFRSLKAIYGPVEAARRLDNGRSLAKVANVTKLSSVTAGHLASPKKPETTPHPLSPSLFQKAEAATEAPAKATTPDPAPDQEAQVIEQIFGFSVKKDASSLYRYGVSSISEKLPKISPTRRGVMAASVTIAAERALLRAGEARGFFDLILGLSSGHDKNGNPSNLGGLGGLSPESGQLAAGHCGLSLSFREEDLENEQANLTLAACLYGLALEHFDRDPVFAAAAYRLMARRGFAPTGGGRGLLSTPSAAVVMLPAARSPEPQAGKAGSAQGSAEAVRSLADIVRSPLARSASRDLTFDLLARVADGMFPGDPKGRTDWLILLSIESKFDGRPASRAGATGIGQLIPAYAADFGAPCGLSAVAAGDLADDATNAVLSACYFRDLVARHDGLVTVALAAYNAGLHSDDVRRYTNLSSMSNEPANYVAKYSRIKEMMESAAKKTSQASRALSAASTHTYPHSLYASSEFKVPYRLAAAGPVLVNE